MKKTKIFLTTWRLIINQYSLHMVRAWFRKPMVHLVIFNDQGKNTPIYCLPGLHGGLVWPRVFSQQLGNDYPVFGIECCHGRFRTLEDLGKQCAQLIHARHSDNQPVILFGYSFGSSIGLAVLHELNKIGHPVTAFVLLDPYPPKSRIHQAIDDFSWFGRYPNHEKLPVIPHHLDITVLSFSNLILGYGQKPYLKMEDVVNKPFKEVLAKVMAQIGDESHIRPTENKLSYRFFWFIQMIQHNTRITKKYSFPEYLGISKICLFIAQHGYYGKNNPLNIPYLPFPKDYYDHAEVWAKIFPNGIEKIEAPCDHFGMCTQPSLGMIVEKLKSFSKT